VAYDRQFQTYYEAILHQKIFTVEEMDKLFPKVNALLSVHQSFLSSLKRRKEERVVVGTIHDIILQQVCKLDFHHDMQFSVTLTYL